MPGSRLEVRPSRGERAPGTLSAGITLVDDFLLPSRTGGGYRMAHALGARAVFRKRILSQLVILAAHERSNPHSAYGQMVQDAK